MRETDDCLPDRGLVLLSQDDDEGLPAAVTECDLRHDPPQHLVVGPELQPAASGCQDSPRVYLHVMELLHVIRRSETFQNNLKTNTSTDNFLRTDYDYISLLNF